MSNDGRLLACGCCGFGIAGVGGVAQCVNIHPGFMAQSGRVDIDPASRVSERADPNEIRRNLRWHHMKEIKVTLYKPGAAIRINAVERCSPCGSVHAGECVAEIQVDAIGRDVFHQGWHIVGHSEQHCAGAAKLDLDVVQDTGTLPMIGRQVHGFLRRPGAFDRHGRLRENRPSITQLLHPFPRVRGKVIQVV
ncbi:hypothetical protein D3C87_1184160 [compost metagenome]